MKQLLLLLVIFTLPFQLIANTNWQDRLSEKEQIESELKIYPNPVKNNQVTIAFENWEMVEIRLVNITGKEVLRESSEFPVQKKTLKLNAVPNGIYILQIKTSQGHLISKKLMVSRS
jgi:hypothetical protein